jgi:hypothetical protein
MPTPMEEVVVDTEVAALHAADRITRLLAKSDWRPTRSHIEEARNALNAAAASVSQMEQEASDAWEAHQVERKAHGDTSVAFHALYRAYVSLLEAGAERIRFLGGDCDPVDVMEDGDPALIAARNALRIVTTKGDAP